MRFGDRLEVGGFNHLAGSVLFDADGLGVGDGRATAEEQAASRKSEDKQGGFRTRDFTCMRRETSGRAVVRPSRHNLQTIVPLRIRSRLWIDVGPVFSKQLPEES